MNRPYLALVTGALVVSSVPCPAQPFTADFGYVSASGNTRLATMNFGERAVVKVRSWSIAQQSAYIYGKTNGVPSANQLKTSLRVDRTFMSRVGFFAGVAYERNRFAGFTRHVDNIAGLSWRVLAFSHDTLRFDAGGVYTDEVRVDSTRRFSPAARSAVAYKHWFGGSSYFTQTAEYIPNLPSDGQFRVNTETALTAKMTKHFGLKLSNVIRYDSRPAATFRKADRILTTGLQVSY